MTAELLDHHLATLATPLTMQERLTALEAAVTYWHGEPLMGDAIMFDDLMRHRLPLALRWAYEHGAGRRGVFSGQNELLLPDRLQADDHGRVPFYAENQWVYVWATEFNAENPPVWGRFNDENTRWELEDACLTTFLTKVVLVEGIFSAAFGASAAWVPQKTLDQISMVVPPLPGDGWRWPAYPTRLHASSGAFVVASPNGVVKRQQGYSVFLGAKTAEPLSFLRNIVDHRWEHVQIE